jgi:hypothetical protein
MAPTHFVASGTLNRRAIRPHARIPQRDLVHELESPQSDILRTGLEDAADQDASSGRQREGLPSHYRMRAERHYVDHLVTPTLGMPVRLIPIAYFADTHEACSGDLDALVRSIRTHGVIQPLLVRKENTAYRVIAGRRRLSAAVAVGLAEVPCIVHQVDDAGEASLRAAAEVRGDVVAARPPAATRASDPLRATVGSKLADGVSAIASDLARLRSTLDLARGAGKGFERAIALNFASAQTWRTLWLANATSFLATGQCQEDARKPLQTVIDDIIQCFEPECRLSGLRFAVEHAAVATPVDRGLVGLALAGAIIVTLSFLEDAEDPFIQVESRSFADGGFALEIKQRGSLVPREIAERFSTHAFSARGAGVVGLAAIALSHATAMYGGAAQLIAGDDVDGTVLRLTFPQP